MNMNNPIIFVGDYIQLKNNFYGNNSDWLRVDDCEVYDICVLSNGVRVCASAEYIASVKSADEYKEMQLVDEGFASSTFFQGIK